MTTGRCARGPAPRSLAGMKKILLVAALVVLAAATSYGVIQAHTRVSLEWTRVVPPAAAGCHCADGSEFAFWEYRADPTKVVFFLNGGGVCWDATGCAFTGDHGESDVYDWSSRGVEPENRSGMFDITDSDNPFADYSFIYVSPCTGDAHLGNTSQVYSPRLTVEHRGYVNGTAALDHLAAHYPAATQVAVIGKTAGSVAAPVYGGLAAERLPNARVTVFGAQSGAWPEHPGFNADVLGARWGAYGALPAWAADGQPGVPGLWARAGRHNPKLVLGRFDFAFDPNAASELAPWSGGNLLATIDANEKAIEAAGVRLHSYTAPGADHQLFERGKFYTIKVRGVRLVDWLGDLIGTKPPADVHCDRCDP